MEGGRPPLRCVGSLCEPDTVIQFIHTNKLVLRRDTEGMRPEEEGVGQVC